jgi:tetratricopeptide (TPR) repeat protein
MGLNYWEIMRAKTSYLLGIFLFSSVLLNGQDATKLLREGNEAYKKGEYLKAEESYRKAEAAEKSYNQNYNLGNSIYQQRRMSEAAERYKTAAEQTTDKVQKGNAYYNMGNALLEGGNLEGAINAYKNALRSNPQDEEAKYNLSQAFRRQKQEQQKQEQQQQQQNDKQQSQSQDDKEQKKEEDDQNNEQQNSSPSSPAEDQKEQSALAPTSLTKEEADQLLKIMAQEEQKVQQKLKKDPKKAYLHGKDW